jgi:hypothetical protein
VSCNVVTKVFFSLVISKGSPDVNISPSATKGGKLNWNILSKTTKEERKNYVCVVGLDYS